MLSGPPGSEDSDGQGHPSSAQGPGVQTLRLH